MCGHTGTTKLPSPIASLLRITYIGRPGVYYMGLGSAGAAHITRATSLTSRPRNASSVMMGAWAEARCAAGELNKPCRRSAQDRLITHNKPIQSDGTHNLAPSAPFIIMEPTKKLDDRCAATAEALMPNTVHTILEHVPICRCLTVHETHSAMRDRSGAGHCT